MLYNVAQLLKGPVGETRQYTVDEPFGPSSDVPFAGNVQGRVKLTNVNQGVVVQAELHAPVALECGRCLEPFQQDLDLSFEERFIPTIDVQSGLPTHEVEEDQDEEDVYTIDRHHQIDLHEAVRQQALLNLPMAPLHAPDCAGLCPLCGADRNREPCSCRPAPPVDPRLADLQGWSPRT